MKLKQLFEAGEDRAVSPVIGVILMVAITVILAAVIGTFVLGLGDDIEQDVQAGATVDQDTDNNQITVTYTSQGTADGLSVKYQNGTYAGNMTSVGGQVTIDSSNFAAGDTFTVVAFQGTASDPQRETVVRTFTADSGF